MKMKSFVAVLLLALLLVSVGCGTTDASVKDVGKEDVVEETVGETTPTPPVEIPEPEVVPPPVQPVQEIHEEEAKPIVRSYEYSGWVVYLNAFGGTGSLEFSGNATDNVEAFLSFLDTKHADSFAQMSYSISESGITFTYPEDWGESEFAPFETAFLNALVEWVHNGNKTEPVEVVVETVPEVVVVQDVVETPETESFDLPTTYDFTFIDFENENPVTEIKTDPFKDSVSEYIKAVQDNKVEVIDYQNISAQDDEIQWIELDSGIPESKETEQTINENVKDSKESGVVPIPVTRNPVIQDEEPSKSTTIVFVVILVAIAIALAALRLFVFKKKKHRH